MLTTDRDTCCSRIHLGDDNEPRYAYLLAFDEMKAKRCLSFNSPDKSVFRILQVLDVRVSCRNQYTDRPVFFLSCEST